MDRPDPKGRREKFSAQDLIDNTYQDVMRAERKVVEDLKRKERAQMISLEMIAAFLVGIICGMLFQNFLDWLFRPKMTEELDEDMPTDEPEEQPVPQQPHTPEEYNEPDQPRYDPRIFTQPI